MSYLLECIRCHATCWVGGWSDWETNSVEFNLDDAEWDWEDDPTAEDMLCEHEDFEHVDTEYQHDDPHWYE